MSTFHYPFTAIIGQDEMCLALKLSAVDPLMGGVLVMGHRGTGKSTAIRALVNVLPKIKAVKNCMFNCFPSKEVVACSRCKNAEKLVSEYRSVPVVNLPLGATEDRIIGSLDIQKALRSGDKQLEPGLLASANRGFLYVDEVNLLDDHLVDLLIDVSASGINLIEREGLSIEHPAQFVLVGSGNPEEGELRPQLLDRFAFSVDVTTPENLEERVKVVKLRQEFDDNPEAFKEKWLSKEMALAKKIRAARTKLGKVKVPEQTLEKIAELCLMLKTDGLRGELSLSKAARACAALNGSLSVSEEHVKRVAVMSLRHRLRRDPLDESSSDTRVKKMISEVFD